MLDLRFNNVMDKSQNKKYSNVEKYVKYQRLYKRFEKEIEERYKRDIPILKKLKSKSNAHEAYVKKSTLGKLLAFKGANNLDENSKRDLEILKEKMEFLNLYFELKKDLAELFSHVSETLGTKPYASGETRDYSSRIDPMIEKINKFRKIKYEGAGVTGGKKRVKKSVKKSVKKRVKKTIKK